MSASFDSAAVARAAKAIAVRAESCRDELNAADAQLGDGDLGITVASGWRAFADHADALPADVGMAFLTGAQAFQRASSSSYGTLTATAFMALAKACKGRTAVPYAEVSALLRAALDAMMARGKGSLGDKTVLDALDAMAAATADLAEPAALRAAADRACDAALVAFRDRPNRLGRARMFGAKSAGLDDPGMLALRRIVDALVTGGSE